MVSISFLGDISLNNEYNELYIKDTKPFSKVSKVLKESDFIVGNLECLASGNEGENLLKKPRLKTNTETLNYLKDLNISLVTLAHNHIYDNLLDGYNSTVQFLDKNNIMRLGSGLSEKDTREPILKEICGIMFCFLNYVTHDTNPSLPTNAEVYLNWFDEIKVIKDVKKYKNQVDYVILLLHWGGKLEGGYYPDFNQPKIAHHLIDAGVDLIVGGHSHTLQPYEIYKGKHIFYSLGNFCFSDIHSDGIIKEIDQKKRTESIVLNIFFNKNSYSVEMIPISSKNLYLEFDGMVLEKYKRRIFYFKIIKKIKILWEIYSLKCRYIDPTIFYFLGNDRKFFERLKLLNFGRIKRFLKG